jgi:uncharacterized membrane protein
MQPAEAPAPPGGQRDVFISHASSPLEVEAAERLADEIRSRNLTCFIDKDELHLGDDYENRIVGAVRVATMVVVLFPQRPSNWVAFEAACAYFDGKLLPVSFGGSVVPEPYNRFQTHTINVQDEKVDTESISAVAEEVERRLLGSDGDRKTIRIVDFFNRIFHQGLQIGLTACLIVALLAIAYRSTSEQALFLHINHLHVILGATILGGQFFVSLAFAKAIASPMHTARDTGFKTAEQLFFFWLWLTPLQPVLGLLMAWIRYGSSPKPGWMWVALVLYMMGLLLTCSAYAIVRLQRDQELVDDRIRSVRIYNLFANVLFLFGFIATVIVITLMLSKPSM